MTDDASIYAQSVLNSEENICRPTDIVREYLLVVNVIEYINSSQEIINAYIAVAKIPGAEIGRTIRNKIPILLQPSIIAASSSVLGRVLMNPRIIITENGSIHKRCVKESASLLSTSPVLFNVRYNGTSVDACGTILHSKISSIRKFFPR